MNIDFLIQNINYKKLIRGERDSFIKPEFDSRKVEANDLFVAIKGTNTDGHKFISNVITNNVAVIVCENIPDNPNSNISWIQVSSGEKALAEIADLFYDNPSSKLKLIGITGTNGKTTIATSLFNITRDLGYKCGLLSTNKIMINNQLIVASHTTPDALNLNRILNDMVLTGCDYCFMEVSSHAVAQNRIHKLNFTGGVFTNLSHDHLDYHKTFADYRDAKKFFFDNLDKSAFALVNIDDKNGEYMIQNTNAKKLSYSLKSDSTYKAAIIENEFTGMMLRVQNSDLWTKFIGGFNAYNLLAVYATAINLGFDNTEVLLAISKLDMVEGRFETVRSNKDITAIIDYAHTPDALENVLKTIADIKRNDGNLTTVVGCGGDRDKTKRPIMAKIAANFSQKVILTSDNPRTENPLDIIEDMKEGLDISDKVKTITIPDRLEAIRTACLMANPGDIILVAGKGHEKYQEINGVRHDFDDKDIVCKTFNDFE